MKAKLLSMLASGAAILTVLGGLDLSGIISLLPSEVATGFSVALPALAAILHAVKAIGDRADDGEMNDSFRYCHPLVVVSALVVALSCMSCSSTPDWSVQTPYGAASMREGGILIHTPVVTPVK